MKVAIIGAGLIGNKRAQALDENDSLIIVCDNNDKKAQELAVDYGADFTENYIDVSRNKAVDVVIISVINKYILPIAIEMLENGKYILNWEFDLNPGETKKIVIIKDYRKPTLLLSLLIMALGLIYSYKRKEIELSL